MIEGPHTTFEGPYQIRVFINYVDMDNWTANADLAGRTFNTLAFLNSVFNPFQIYFIGENYSCEGNYQILPGNTNSEHLHAGAIDIFDRGDTGGQTGYGFYIPNDFLETTGSENGVPASQSFVIIHEMGHQLGLSHTFYPEGATGGTGCYELTTTCSSGNSPCFCCGDFVCDTPISQQNITASSDCSSSLSPSGLPLAVFRNYMSYTVPGRCRDQFSPGQVARMWDYLAKAPVLLAVQAQPLIYPANTPSGTSGDIIVESGELIINSPLEMLPGSKIFVEKGAKLTINSTITGACGKMWKGIIVEGDASDNSQSVANTLSGACPGEGVGTI